MKTIYLFIALLFSLTSCLEIIDDLTIKNDGSGSLKYTINMSSNKIKINSILALDSLDGKKVPSIAEIKDKVEEFKNALAKKEGIKLVKVDQNFEQFIFKFQIDFNSLEELQAAIKMVVQEQFKDKTIKELNENWLSWDGQKLVRYIPDFTLVKTKELKDDDYEATKKGTYTSITRFERGIEKAENTKTVISPNRLNSMLRSDVHSILQNPKSMQNTIILTPLKN